VMVFWLAIIFMSFSLFSRLNPSVIVALFVFALSASAAIFLILEMSQPFTGLMQISSAPLRNALAPPGAVAIFSRMSEFGHGTRTGHAESVGSVWIRGKGPPTGNRLVRRDPTNKSASLIGRLGQALSGYPPRQCRCRSRARASLRTRHQGASIMGFEDEMEQSYERPCRGYNGRFKRTYDLTSSIVPRGT